MNNTVYNFPTRVVGGYTARDYTAIQYQGIPELLRQYPQYFTAINLADDDKIENIAYKMYGSEDYADVILACNEENFLWSMPYNSDLLLTQEESWTTWVSWETNVTPSEPAYETLRAKIAANLDQTNSEKRKFIMPKPEKMNDVITLIEILRSENTVADLDKE